jgi:hypothetical protein
MDTNRLAKLYDVLKPAERIPLLLDADARGDRVEYDRLARIAPRSTYTIPDFYPMLEGLWFVATLHMIEMLQYGMYLWCASGLWVNGRLDPQHRDKARQAMGFQAYRLLILFDGWRLWGTQLGIDLDILLKWMPAYDLLLQTVAFARDAAWTTEEATAHQGGKPAPTAANVAAELQKALDAWIKKQG